MKDLLLWRLLREPVLDVATVTSLLQQLAASSPRERIPFLGAVLPLTEHTDSKVRIAALRVLAGADGLLAVRAQTTALDDPDDAVAVAAVNSLHGSCSVKSTRGAHAIFHRNPAVRKAALQSDPTRGEENYEFYLLADDICHDDVCSRIDESIAEGHAIRASTDSLQAALDFVRTKILDESRARRWFAALDSNTFAPWINASSGREDAADQLNRRDLLPYLKSEASRTATDPIEALLDLYWNESEQRNEEEIRATQTFYWRLSRVALKNKQVRARTLLASFVTALRNNRWSQDAAIVCAAFGPRFAASEWVPLDLRRMAVSALYTTGHSTVKGTDAEAMSLLRSDLVLDSYGTLDLDTIGALSFYFRSGATEKIIGLFGRDAIVSAMISNPVGSSRFFALLDESPQGQQPFITDIARQDPEHLGEILATFAIIGVSPRYAFLGKLSPQIALAVSLAILHPSPMSPVGPPPGSGLEMARYLCSVMTIVEHTAFLHAWLSSVDPHENQFGLEMLSALGFVLPSTAFSFLFIGLPMHELRAALLTFPHATSLPWWVERALSEELRGYPDATVVAWANARLVSETPIRVRLSAPRNGTPISEKLALDLLSCADSEIDALIAPCLESPCSDLAYALSNRLDPATPSIPVCVALIATHDDVNHVARQFDRFSSSSPDFLDKFDRAVIDTWMDEPALPPLARAWMHRWDRHTLPFLDSFINWYGDLNTALRAFDQRECRVLEYEIWNAVAEAFSTLVYRDKKRLLTTVTDDLIQTLIFGLALPVSVPAARALGRIHHSKLFATSLEAHRSEAIVKLADAPEEARAHLQAWIVSKGLMNAASALFLTADTDEQTLAKIRASRDVVVLTHWCNAANVKIVQESALRLIEIGADGLQALSEILHQTSLPLGVRYLIESIPSWPASPQLAWVRELLAQADTVASQVRFRIALAFYERGEHDALTFATSAACEPEVEPWFRPTDWDRLRAGGIEENELSIALATSPHPHAYNRAVLHLVKIEAPTDEILKALRDFLDQGTDRLSALRVLAAEHLRSLGDLMGYPILLSHALSDQSLRLSLTHPSEPTLAHDTILSLLVAGPLSVSESYFTRLLSDPNLSHSEKLACHELILSECTLELTRTNALAAMDHRASRVTKLRKIADTFVWGVRLARTLTGRVFTIDMITGEGLGYTRLNENRVHVSVLPILRGERDGREIVEGLILHELGHQMYHCGPDGLRTWEQAKREGIHGLFNLVADEHLERNLRALDTSYGDRLKRLVSYAFQHSVREVPVAVLLRSLQSNAFEVLSSTHLEPARQDGCVRIDNGDLLHAMERRGMAFSRFMRALRMGLGDRHGDPLVARGLALFQGNFRNRSMTELLAIARQLKEIFGWETRLVESLGPHESHANDGPEGTIHRDQLTNEDIQREVDRIANPRGRRSGGSSGGGGRPWINANPELAFNPITSVVAIPYDAEKHRQIATKVAGSARQLRKFLIDLGLARRPQRFRLHGRRFDTSRTQAVVLRGDPRMLITRETRVHNDLFLGMMIDCSGSMVSRANIEKARVFATMMAEAAKNIDGVEVRVFGFTDTVIYDAGNATRCAAHALVANGGNNDAAALSHLASVANSSGRRAKLLVMISDGLPSGCSVAALKELVSTLTRKHRMCCAQIAVQPLAEVCFPNYVELKDADGSTSVRAFGTVIAKLIRKAMAGR